MEMQVTVVCKLNLSCSRVVCSQLPLVNTSEVSHALALLSPGGLKLLSELLVN